MANHYQDKGFYNITDNLWNVKSRLSPKFTQYSQFSDQFKKSPRDLEKIKEQELNEEQERSYKNLLKAKQES